MYRKETLTTVSITKKLFLKPDGNWPIKFSSPSSKSATLFDKNIALIAPFLFYKFDNKASKYDKNFNKGMLYQIKQNSIQNVASGYSPYKYIMYVLINQGLLSPPLLMIHKYLLRTF